MENKNPYIHSIIAKYSVRNLDDVDTFRRIFPEAVGFYCKSMWQRIFGNKLNFLLAAGRKNYDFFIKFSEYYFNNLVKRPSNCFFITYAVFDSNDDEFIEFFIQLKYLLPSTELLFLLAFNFGILDKFQIELREEWKEYFMNIKGDLVYHLVKDHQICDHPDISAENFYAPVYTKTPITGFFCEHTNSIDKEILYINLFRDEDFGMPWFPGIQGTNLCEMKKKLLEY